MKKIVLILASSFPLDNKSNKGNFIFEFAQKISENYAPLVLTHHLGTSKKSENINGISVFRYPFLPLKSLEKYFVHGVLYAFSNWKLLFIFFAPIYFLCQLFYIRKLVRKENIQLIHAHWIIPQGLAAVLYRKLFNKQIKIIATIHGGDIFAFKGWFGSALKKYVIRNTDELTVVSQAIKQEVLKLISDKIVHVLPMGVDTKKFHPNQYDTNFRKKHIPNGTILLFVGRLVEKKGVKYLIQAMPEIIKTTLDVKLLIVGDGPLLPVLKRLAQDLNVDHSIEFLGNIAHAELPKYFASSDIFIGPSITAKTGDSEGFGLVFAEAAASKTLVITTDSPAIRDIIKNESTGIVVIQQSAVNIAERVIEFIEDPKAYQEIKEQASQHVRTSFDWDIIVEKYESLYQRMLC